MAHSLSFFLIYTNIFFSKKYILVLVFERDCGKVKKIEKLKASFLAFSWQQTNPSKWWKKIKSYEAMPVNRMIQVFL